MFSTGATHISFGTARTLDSIKMLDTNFINYAHRALEMKTVKTNYGEYNLYHRRARLCARHRAHSTYASLAYMRLFVDCDLHRNVWIEIIFRCKNQLTIEQINFATNWSQFQWVNGVMVKWRPSTSATANCNCIIEMHTLYRLASMLRHLCDCCGWFESTNVERNLLPPANRKNYHIFIFIKRSTH